MKIMSKTGRRRRTPCTESSGIFNIYANDANWSQMCESNIL